jgi:hypothetical protein
VCFAPHAADEHPVERYRCVTSPSGSLRLGFVAMLPEKPIIKRGHALARHLHYELTMLSSPAHGSDDLLGAATAFVEPARCAINTQQGDAS